jgi:hypothetical protein
LGTVLLGASVESQTLVPKWSNSQFGPNQIYINGGAFNPATSNLLVCGSFTHFIDVCQPSDGSMISSLDMTGVSGGTYTVSGMTVDSNGYIYACNYAAAGATKLYYWTNETATPMNFANSTLGVGTIGKTMAMYGQGTNAVFILSSTSTGAVYVYYNGVSWVSKQLTVSSQTAQGGMVIISWSRTNCVFITKNSGINGQYNVFNPSSTSPIAVTQTAYASVAMKFSSLTATSTTAQCASAYDPATGLFAFHTRSLTASPFTISNYLVATFNSNGIAAPNGCSPIVSGIGTDGSAADSSNYGADFWGQGVYYCIPCTSSGNYGFCAYDISAYKINDITPLTPKKNIGDTVTFSVVSGGSGALTYEWKANGVALSDTNEYSGSSTATLTISPASLADTATYTCTITGAGGISWTTTNGVLTVASPVSAPALNGAIFSSAAGFSFGFTNASGSSASFTIYSSTNITTPFNLWLNLGHPSETSSGFYQFTDATAKTNTQLFYRVTSP